MLKVISVNTDFNKDFCRFIYSCQKNNIDLKVLGFTQNWGGWYWRLKLYQEYLKTLDPSQIVIICDSNDVFFVDNSENILEKYKRIRNNNNIVVSAEKSCCVLQLVSSVYNKKEYYDIFKEAIIKRKMEIRNNTLSPYSYLNFGVMIGEVEYILKIFDTMNLKKGDDDQAVLSKLWLNNPNILILDYNQIIFTNTDEYKSNKCLEIKNNRIYNKYTHSFPSIIHSPGGDNKCRIKLYNSIYNNYNFQKYVTSDIFYNYMNLSIDIKIKILSTTLLGVSDIYRKRQNTSLIKRNFEYILLILFSSFHLLKLKIKYKIIDDICKLTKC